MKKSFKNWFQTKANELQKIHFNQKNRATYRNICWLIYAAIFLIFCVCTVLFALAGLKFDSNDPDSYPYFSLSTSAAIAFLVIGLILFIADTIFGAIIAFILPGLFKESQHLYFQTSKYKKIRVKYMQSDLSSKSKKEIKWLYKLKYIDQTKFEHEMKIIEKSSNKKNTTIH